MRNQMWGIRDVLERTEDKIDHYWYDLFKPRFTGKHYGKNRGIEVATYMVTRAMELAWHDMIDNGTEICFMTKKRNPFMILFIKDFKYVAKFHKYNMKFRGNLNKIFLFFYTSLYKRMDRGTPRTWMQYFLYLNLSMKAQRGMDYPAMPDMSVYREMRAAYHDVGKFKSDN